MNTHAKTTPWWARKRIAIPALLLAAVTGLACSGGGSDANDTGSAIAGGVADVEPGGSSNAKDTDGVYKFGQTVKFKDGSTLAVGKPKEFKRGEYAIGGEDFKTHIKFKATFTNNTKEVFDPALTSGSASAGGVEGDSVYQKGLDAPDNKVLPGKSVTWYMGYGVQSTKDLQLEVRIGFLDYGSVIFTN